MIIPSKEGNAGYAACGITGDSTPSDADIKVTRDLIRAGQLLKFEILDHVIVGETFHSLRQLGFFR
jgi:DNA repair protein RadC